jgi:hypothetical protein
VIHVGGAEDREHEAVLFRLICRHVFVQVFRVCRTVRDETQIPTIQNMEEVLKEVLFDSTYIS